MIVVHQKMLYRVATFRGSPVFIVCFVSKFLGYNFQRVNFADLVDNKEQVCYNLVTTITKESVPSWRISRV